MFTLPFPIKGDVSVVLAAAETGGTLSSLKKKLREIGAVDSATVVEEDRIEIVDDEGFVYDLLLHGEKWITVG